MPGPDVKAGLTKKIGPLPVWGYGVAVTGGLLGWRLLKGGGGSDTELVATPTGAPDADPSYPSSGAFSGLIDRINDLENRGKEQPIPVANPQNNSPGKYKPLPTTPKPTPKNPQTGGRILPIKTTRPSIVRPMIPRSSKPTSPPPSSSAPRRVAPAAIRKVTTKPVSTTRKPAPKPVAAVKKVATRPTIGVIKSNPTRYARTATRAVVTKPKPKPAPRKLAPVARGGARVL